MQGRARGPRARLYHMGKEQGRGTPMWARRVSGQMVLEQMSKWQSGSADHLPI